MTGRTLDELRTLAEGARQRTHLDALDAVRRRLRDDVRLERALESGTLEPYGDELIARAQVVELDPVTLRNLVDAADALVGLGAEVLDLLGTPFDLESPHAELERAVEVARARFVEVQS